MTGLRDNKQEWQFQEVVGPCKSSRGLPLSEEPSGERDMCGLKSRLLGRYLFFWPPRPSPVVVTSLEPGSGCSNKVGRVGFLAGQERVIDQCHRSFPPSSSCPRADVTDTGRGGKESWEDALLGSGGWHSQDKDMGEVKHKLSEAQELLNVSRSGLQVDVVHSAAEQMHLQI